jgi:hypothetical protein
MSSLEAVDVPLAIDASARKPMSSIGISPDSMH